MSTRTRDLFAVTLTASLDPGRALMVLEEVTATEWICEQCARARTPIPGAPALVTPPLPALDECSECGALADRIIGTQAAA